MPSLIDTIKSEARGSAIKIDSGSLVLSQKFNKLFYLKPNYPEEIKFLLIKRGSEEVGRVGLHASAIIVSDNEFCYREQVLSLFYKQSQGENIPVSLKRIFAEGDAIHEKWQRLFIRGGLGTADDMDRTRFKEEYDISFSPDGIIKMAGKEMVAEIKSVNTFQFKHMESHPSGKKQLMLYMYLTGVHEGFVLAEDKNTQDFKVFAYKYDEEAVLPYIERLEAIQEYKHNFIKNHKMVKGICDKATCKRAEKCNMRDACYNVGMGRVKLNA